MPEWTQYGSRDLKKYTKIRWLTHTAHIPSAVNILKAGEVKPSLVFDESKLNDKRILVSWLSPNVWNTGYRYGTVQFKFNFRKLVENKKLYWVEAGKYKIPAPRILITDAENDYGLEEYSFEDETGPWKYDSENDEYSFHSEICLELMIQDSISLEHLDAITIVPHHPNYCSLNRKNPKNCDEIEMNEFQAAARFLATCLVNKVELKKIWSKTKISSRCFQGFADHISEDADFSGPITFKNNTKYTFIRSFLAAVAFRNKKDADVILDLFGSEDDFLRSLCKFCMSKTDGSGFNRKLEKSL